jgi:hypothetical protein
MSNENLLSFVACPNHETNEGFGKLYFVGNGIFRCSLCNREFTREQIEDEVEKDYRYKLKDLQQWYQQSMASLHKDYQENVNKLDEVTAPDAGPS